MYKIVFTRTARKEYEHLYKTNKAIFRRVRAALNFLSENPASGKPLKLTLKGKWSYRVGMYRIIYLVEHNILTVCVLDIGHRGDVYK